MQRRASRVRAARVSIGSSKRTRVVLVRHGQASAGRSDYDQLSELGAEQSRHVGSYLARWARETDHVIVGPRKRHAQTFEAAMSTLRDAGARWPEPEQLAGFDEHHGIQLMQRLGADLVRRDDAVGEAARLAFGGKAEDPVRAWMKLVRAVLDAWSRAELGHPEVESWADFRSRVRIAVERLRERSGTIVVFTSGGAVSAAVGDALGLDDARVLDLAWAIRNASITELSVGSGGAPTLASFNVTAHLPTDELVTFV